jgi:predicted N-formylglutamate amidohydrolase
MHAAVLYNRDRRFAGLVLDMLRREALPHVEIEIRQDLVSGEAGQIEWAARIARALRDAEEKFFGASRSAG